MSQGSVAWTVSHGRDTFRRGDHLVIYDARTSALEAEHKILQSRIASNSSFVSHLSHTGQTLLRSRRLAGSAT